MIFMAVNFCGERGFGDESGERNRLTEHPCESGCSGPVARCKLIESVINLPIKLQSVKHSLFLYGLGFSFGGLGPQARHFDAPLGPSKAQWGLLIINGLQI